MSKYRTKKEQKKICRAWEQSGLTKAEFCRRNIISSRSLDRWLRKLKKDVINTRGSNLNISIIVFDPQVVKFFSCYHLKRQVESRTKSCNVTRVTPKSFGRWCPAHNNKAVSRLFKLYLDCDKIYWLDARSHFCI